MTMPIRMRVYYSYIIIEQTKYENSIELLLRNSQVIIITMK